MAAHSSMLQFCVGVSLLIWINAECSQTQTYLPGLRHYRVVSLHGRFKVPRYPIEEVLRNFKEANFDDDVEIAIPPARPAGIYDESLYGEIILADMNLQERRYDPALGREVVDDHRSLLVTTPFVSGETHGVVVLAEITDSHTNLTSPMIPNKHLRIEVDTVDVGCGPERSVTYRTAEGDRIQLTSCYDAMCDVEGQETEDFTAVFGEPILSMALTGHFDWGCGGEDHDFCDDLEAHRSGLDDAGANVCVGHSAVDSRRCPAASVRIDAITGIFLEEFPYLGIHLPNESVESEFLDRGHNASITYPCLC